MNYTFADKVANLKPSAIREIFKSLADPSIISFAGGNPNPKSFPVDAIAKISAEIFSDPKSAAASLQYSITDGYPALIEKITARQKQKFGMGRDFDKLIITTGGQQAADLVCKVLCNEGDVVICENPSFIGAMNAFRANGAKLVGVEVKDDGVGFDTSLPVDEKKHVGIRNVRERLQVLCAGSLTVDSQKGKGTVALIRIPKEGKKQ